MQLLPITLLKRQLPRLSAQQLRQALPRPWTKRLKRVALWALTQCSRREVLWVSASFIQESGVRGGIVIRGVIGPALAKPTAKPGASDTPVYTDTVSYCGCPR
jgi:hypothetical protein